MSKNTNFRFTREGFENLRKEYDHLLKRRPQVVINLSNAREQGDLSENAGFHAAKEELSQIDSRIRELKYLLRVGKVVDKAEGEKVIFGSRLIVEVNGESFEYQIVEEMEANPKEGTISTNSLIGSSLINRKAGEEIAIKIPDGQVIYKIIKIF